MQNLCIMVVMILYAPKKHLNHKIDRDINFPFLMLVSDVLPKKLPNSEHFPHWQHLLVAR